LWQGRLTFPGKTRLITKGIFSGKRIALETYRRGAVDANH
jgi:hypothetical protein